MYKVKVAVLYTNDDNCCNWNYGWIDWDGLDNKDLDYMVEDYGKSEEKNLQQIVDKSIRVEKCVILETFDITDGKYQCCSCECFFDEPDDGDCPFCGSGNFVEGCIDDSFDYHCEKCEQFFDVPLDNGNCPECGGDAVVHHPKPKQCFNHCPKCDATDPDIEWGDEEWLDQQAYQSAECKKCGCNFKEYYKYSDTEIDGEQ